MAKLWVGEQNHFTLSWFGDRWVYLGERDGIKLSDSQGAFPALDLVQTGSKQSGCLTRTEVSGKCETRIFMVLCFQLIPKHAPGQQLHRWQGLQLPRRHPRATQPVLAAANHRDRTKRRSLLRQFTHQPLFESAPLCLKIYGALFF